MAGGVRFAACLRDRVLADDLAKLVGPVPSFPLPPFFSLFSSSLPLLLSSYHCTIVL